MASEKYAAVCGCIRDISGRCSNGVLEVSCGERTTQILRVAALGKEIDQEIINRML